MSDRGEFNSEEAAYRSWGGLRDLMTESSWSDEGRSAGVWAVDQLHQILGDQWLYSQTSNVLLLSPYNPIVFAGLLDFALRLHLLRDLGGMEVVRSELIRDVRSARRVHTRLMLDVAGLAVQRGHDVELAKRLKSDLPPTDVVLTTGSGILAVEASVVHLDKSMRDGRKHTDRIFHGLDRIRSIYGVELNGELGTVLSDDETTKWLAQVEETASRVKADGQARTFDHPNGSVTVLPLSDIGQNPPVFTGPPMTGDNNDRLSEILAKKAAHAVEVGATWIRVDVVDGLWQFTQWATWPLREKGEALAQAVKQALSDFHGLHGAVLSSGPLMAPGYFVNESVQLSEGGFAMTLNLPSSLARETVIVPLATSHANEVADWIEMYTMEPDWLDWALSQAGLPPSVAVFAPRS